MPLAEWSGKGAVENQQYVGFTEKIGEADSLALEILQGEIGGGSIEGDFWHILYP
jgi:hypothetical protein